MVCPAKGMASLRGLSRKGKDSRSASRERNLHRALPAARATRIDDSALRRRNNTRPRSHFSTKVRPADRARVRPQATSSRRGTRGQTTANRDRLRQRGRASTGHRSAQDSAARHRKSRAIQIRSSARRAAAAAPCQGAILPPHVAGCQGERCGLPQLVSRVLKNDLRRLFSSCASCASPLKHPQTLGVLKGASPLFQQPFRSGRGQSAARSVPRESGFSARQPDKTPTALRICQVRPGAGIQGEEFPCRVVACESAMSRRRANGTRSS